MGHAVEDRICEVCGKDSFPLTSYAIARPIVKGYSVSTNYYPCAD